MLNLEKALSIPGWMTEQELVWLAEAAAKSKVVAEIGSWRGRSTRAMIDNSDAVVFCIDSWSDEAIGYPGWWTVQESPNKYRHANWLWGEFAANLGDALGNRIVPMRMFSAEAYEILRDRGIRFDMVFIDGSHDAPHVRGDIVMFRELLKPGGVLSGHDYNEPSCPEVAPTVDAIVGQVEVTGTIWRAI